MLGFADADLQGAHARRQAGQEAMMTGIKDVGTAAVDWGINTGKIPGGVVGQDVTSTSFQAMLGDSGGDMASYLEWLKTKGDE